jgi:hypothetical protein
MTMPSGQPKTDDIARVARAIWQAEGRPEGCDHEHWMRAKQLLEEGRAEIEYPESAAVEKHDQGLPSVQPGLEDEGRGMVPRMKTNPGQQPRDGFAQQLAEAPEQSAENASRPIEPPGPRNPAPMPPTNAEGYVAVPSVEDAAGLAIGDDPQPPREGRARSSGRAGATPRPAAV